MTSILTVSEIFWPEGGGAERATYLILKLLAQKGFKITIVTGTDSPAIIPEVKYYVTGYLKSYNRLTRWTLARLLATSHAFIKLLKEHDVLYIPLAAYPLIPIAKKAGLRVVVHLHNYMPIRYNGVKYFFEPDIVSLSKELKLAVFHEFHVQKSLLRTLLSPLSLIGYALSKGWLTKADKIICVSKRQAEIVSKNHPQLASKVEVIYNPLPTELMTTKVRKNLNSIPKFLYVGGESYIKGFHVFLCASARFLSKGNNAEFILTGCFHDKSESIIRSLNKKFNNSYKLVGRLRWEKLLEIHSKIHGLIFPSISEEPLPYTVMESMLAGTIPIASKIGGIPEMVRGTFAERTLFEVGDADELESKMELVVSMSDKQIADVGYALIGAALKKFNPEIVKRKLLRVFSNDDSRPK
jgi:glycosyltransferase involved in cell wall biosynthesis